MGYVREVGVSAPVERVWQAWTSSEEAQRWLAPRANVEFAAGGAYEFFWDDDPTVDSTLGCKLLEWVPTRRLLFEWQGKREFLGMFQPPGGSRTTVAVHFAPAGAGTIVRVVQEETRDGPEWAAYDAWMAMAWEMALEGLKRHCEGTEGAPYWDPHGGEDAAAG